MADEFISNEFIYDSSNEADPDTETASEATKAYAGSQLTPSDVGKLSGEIPVPDDVMYSIILSGRWLTRENVLPLLRAVLPIVSLLTLLTIVPLSLSSPQKVKPGF